MVPATSSLAGFGYADSGIRRTSNGVGENGTYPKRWYRGFLKYATGLLQPLLTDVGLHRANPVRWIAWENLPMTITSKPVPVRTYTRVRRGKFELVRKHLRSKPTR